jgi:hypothetical protein
MREMPGLGQRRPRAARCGVHEQDGIASRGELLVGSPAGESMSTAPDSPLWLPNPTVKR